ncbi:uncharacterized protein [Primulina huaijiensis]|uniref:uncharacterized protein isoform X2 n=1 Tax=Primulina huaijiensis TaxID=1492673 RepID=UPI003CC7623D
MVKYALELVSLLVKLKCMELELELQGHKETMNKNTAPCHKETTNKNTAPCVSPVPQQESLYYKVASKQQTFSSFDELLEKSDKPVLVDFYATWCGPCQFMDPILEQVSTKMEGKILVVKIDTEKYSSLANEYSIKALPTFILFVNGKPVDRFEGAMTADKLIERIETSLKVKQSGRGLKLF